MGKFNKTGKREMPALNTSSLPDLIFTLLFFFMIVTTMREVTLRLSLRFRKLQNWKNWKRNHWLRLSM